MKRVFLIISLMFIYSCKSPDKYYFDTILKMNFLPFTTPVSDVAPGSLYSGDSMINELISVGPAEDCFYGDRLIYEREVDVPQEIKSFTISSDVNVDGVTNAGTPLFKFKYNTKMVKSMNLTMNGARKILLNARQFARFYLYEMDPGCQEDLTYNDLMYISEAYKVEGMNISFVNTAGSQAELNIDNLGDFIELEANANWEIINNSTLSVKTPKYIGYKMGYISYNNEDGYYYMYESSSLSSEVESKNQFVYKKKYRFRKPNSRTQKALGVSIMFEEL